MIRIRSFLPIAVTFSDGAGGSIVVPSHPQSLDLESVPEPMMQALRDAYLPNPDQCRPAQMTLEEVA